MESSADRYDLVLIGSYTRDTIVTAAGTRVADGGGFNYGAHAAVLLPLKVAAVTRLSREDSGVVEGLRRLGVSVFATFTPASTHLRLVYPSADLDERVISVTRSAGSFTPAEVRPLRARAFLVNASMRGEVGLEVLDVLAGKGALLGLDAQGFVRVRNPEGKLVYQEWPDKQAVLSRVSVLKADSVEAEMLTGEKDLRAAARTLASWGPRELVLTHKHGLLVFAEGCFHEAPFLPERLAGRSGRGDTCFAAYVARRLDASVGEAARWAAAVTTLKLEAEGPVSRTRAEVEELIARKYPGPTAG